MVRPECFGGEKGARDRHQDFAEEVEGVFVDRCPRKTPSESYFG